MNERGERIRDMADQLCRGKRYEAADRHVEAMRVTNEITGGNYHGNPRHDFLDGWDAAMATRSEELLDENRDLHGIVMALCQRLCVERCKVCRGQGVDDNLDDCPHCDNGWIDKPAIELKAGGCDG